MLFYPTLLVKIIERERVDKTLINRCNFHSIIAFGIALKCAVLIISSRFCGYLPLYVLLRYKNAFSLKIVHSKFVKGKKVKARNPNFSKQVVARVRHHIATVGGTYNNTTCLLRHYSKAAWIRNAELDKIIRVDHAGELGADRIYAGQMAILGHTSSGPLIEHMWNQEKVHRAKFEELIRKYRVRPTVLVPLWNVAGFMLGAGTALMGDKAAMACTVAVETVIVDHYNDQLRMLMENRNVEKELLETITRFRDEEQEHHDMGIDQGAEQAPFYKALTEVIKAGCKVAIGISKVI